MIGFGQEVDSVVFSDLYYLQRALGDIEKGEYQSAVMHYGSVFQSNPNQNASVYDSRGFCYYKLKKYNLFFYFQVKGKFILNKINILK